MGYKNVGANFYVDMDLDITKRPHTKFRGYGHECFVPPNANLVKQGGSDLTVVENSKQKKKMKKS